MAERVGLADEPEAGTVELAQHFAKQVRMWKRIPTAGARWRQDLGEGRPRYRLGTAVEQNAGGAARRGRRKNFDGIFHWVSRLGLIRPIRETHRRTPPGASAKGAGSGPF